MAQHLDEGSTEKVIINKRAPNPIDVYVGNRIRLRRKIMGISQEKLGEAIGITFQQVQKYEKGVNRIGAGRLHEIAGVLQVSISYFFDDAPDMPASVEDDNYTRPPSNLSNFMASSQGVALNTAFLAIQDQKVRKRLVELIQAIAAGDEEFVETAAE